MLNWQHFDRAIALGYEYTTRRLADLPADATRVEARSREILMPTEQEWRDKYREVLSRLAADEARWSKTQNVLKLLIGRLCLAATGSRRAAGPGARHESRTSPASRSMSNRWKYPHLRLLSAAVAALDSAEKAAPVAPTPAPVAKNSPSSTARPPRRRSQTVLRIRHLQR